MKVTFIKGRGKHDEARFERPNGRIETLPCPKQGIVPHDMIHLVVEERMAARGFMGRLAQGEAAAFRMPSDAVSDGVERLVEVIQGDAWSAEAASANDMLDLYSVTCRARACPPLPVSADDIEAIRARLRDLDARWRALPVGGELVLEA